MKRIFAAVLFVLCATVPAFASMNSDFHDNFRLGALADYNRDVATMMGLADFHTGRGVTFPGFDVGVSVAAVKTASDNFSSEDYLYAPFITAETQLPLFNLGIALRGTKYDGFQSLGGGVKWHGSLAFVNLSAGAFYDRYGTDYYDGDHYSASASASVNILFLTPYVGIGYDYSEMKVKDMGVLFRRKGRRRPGALHRRRELSPAATVLCIRRLYLHQIQPRLSGRYRT